MDDIVVSGVDAKTLWRRAAAGVYVKIAKGLYLTREPTPGELLAIAMRRWPQAVATGPTAREIYLGQPLSFPLHLAAPRKLPRSAYVSGYRTQRLAALQVEGARVHIPALTIDYCTDEEAVELLEQAYRGRKAKSVLEQHIAGRRLSKRARGLIGRASIGSDSPLERKLVRALRDAGYRVDTNVQVGQYFFDLHLPELKMLIEVDGYQFHTAESPDTFIRDRWKANEATLAGYTVLRYSGSCVHYHLKRVVKQVTQPRPAPMASNGVWNWHSGIIREVSWARYR
ncbi:endonuclease domain-containing protein [Corynebacterium sp. 32222D000AT]|uniref:endonuclease domain-containing protein n=1 Tax=unclassified Corynebacterium TaxID=2624378 RepID=UPI002A9B5712|nr:DUF559 domain-containing protein [Mycobacteriaceae bacterium]MDY5829892.1 DUF559 domain-containing protein [Corynebacterium sp.]